MVTGFLLKSGKLKIWETKKLRISKSGKFVEIETGNSRFEMVNIDFLQFSILPPRSRMLTFRLRRRAKIVFA